MVYVDDFKLAAPKDKMKEVWKTITSVVDMDEPEELNVCLGTGHKMTEEVDEGGNKIRVMEYDMKDFMRQCVESYLEKVPGAKMRKMEASDAKSASVRMAKACSCMFTWGTEW